MVIKCKVCHDAGDNRATVKAPKHVMRKYVPEYIKFVLIMADNDAGPHAQCLECDQIL